MVLLHTLFVLQMTRGMINIRVSFQRKLPVCVDCLHCTNALKAGILVCDPFLIDPILHFFSFLFNFLSFFPSTRVFLLLSFLSEQDFAFFFLV